MEQATTASGRPVSPAGELAVIQLSYERFPVRLVLLDESPWFLLDDLCTVLRINRSMLNVTLRNEQKVLSQTYLRTGKAALHVNDDAVRFLSEVGLYELVLCSYDTAAAMRFRRWITHEVLPTLHRSIVPSARTEDVPFRVRKVKLGRQDLKTNAPHALYRFYDIDGQLLYVGISWRPAQRMLEHRMGKEWWSQVGDVTFEHYPNHAEADEAETTAIRSERPLYNIAKAG